MGAGTPPCNRAATQKSGFPYTEECSTVPLPPFHHTSMSPGHVIPNSSRKEEEWRVGGRTDSAFLQKSLVTTLVQFCYQRNGSGGPEDEAVEADCGPSEGTGPSSSQGQK